MDPHDRAMLIGAYLSRPQPAPYNPWAAALQPQRSPRLLVERERQFRLHNLRLKGSGLRHDAPLKLEPRTEARPMRAGRCGGGFLE
jgi:hypothetical protein